MLFPSSVPPAAAASVPVSEVIDVSPEIDIREDAESAPLSTEAEAILEVPAAPGPPLAKVGPRRNTRENRC